MPHHKITKNVTSLVRNFSKATRKILEKIDRAPVFLNLTNHPHSDWDFAQREAALALAASIVDLPFPAVPADADEAAIGALAEDVCANLPPGVSHALVQGEFTLTLAIVQRLQRRGIVCLAATSERRAEPLADGRKASAFAFVRFRAFPSTSTAE